MSDIFAQQLNKLMGKNRNRIPTDKERMSNFDDSCPFYLWNFCPHDLFTNTKADLGPCNKSHDPKQKILWEQIDDREKLRYNFEESFIRYLRKLIYDLGKRMERQQEKVESQHKKDVEKFKEKTKTLPIVINYPKQIEEVEKRIEELLIEMEALGEQGSVFMSHKSFIRLEQMKTERETLVNAMKKEEDSRNEKRMSLCEICGACLLAKDIDKRMLTHTEGKLHQGYARIREALEIYYVNFF